MVEKLLRGSLLHEVGVSERARMGGVTCVAGGCHGATLTAFDCG